MNRGRLIAFLEKELGVKGITDGTGGWIRGCCPTHSETRSSWGIYADAEHHPTKCFVCGVSSILGITMRALEMNSKEATALLSKYGYVGQGLTQDQLGKISFPSYEKRIPIEKPGIIPTYMIAPYEGKNLDTVKRRFDYEEQYLKQLRLGYDSVNQRVIIPWFYNGQMVGVTGRHIRKTPHMEPKTLPYYHTQKGKNLYLPSGKIDGSRPFVLLEGEGDAMNVNRLYTNNGAVCCATLSLHQKKLLLSHGVDYVIVIRDPDPAGKVFAESVREIFNNAYCKVTILHHPRKDAGAMKLMELKNRLKELVWLS